MLLQMHLDKNLTLDLQKDFLLGYQTRTKGYVILDFQTKNIFISRNVIFYESFFPFIPNNMFPEKGPQELLPMITNNLFLGADSLTQQSNDNAHTTQNNPIPNSPPKSIQI